MAIYNLFRFFHQNRLQRKMSGLLQSSINFVEGVVDVKLEYSKLFFSVLFYWTLSRSARSLIALPLPDHALQNGQ